MRLEGQRVLITGGASGLGAAIVARFIDEGARVGVLDRSEARLAELVGRLGAGVVATHGDVRALADQCRAVDAVVTAFGGLDVLIGNAGIWDFGRSLADLPPERIDAAFDEVMGINVKGYLLAAKAALPPLVASGGAIVFTVSNAGFFADGGGPLYTASKHAAVGLVRQLAFELAPRVRVNGVAPGAILTDLRGPAALGMENRSIGSIPLTDALKGLLPLDAVPSPEDYTGAYVFLASKRDSGAATGTIVNIDGGFAARGVGRTRGGDMLAERFASKGH